MNRYIDADKLIAEIKGLQCEQGFEDGMEEREYQFAIQDILSIINSLHQEQPSLPSDIDEAANKFGFKETHERLREGEITRKNEGMFRWQIEKAFKAGAEWMVGQGVKATASIAEQFAKIVRANLSEISNNTQSQFEQLYFEITGTKMYGGYND